MRHQAQNCNKVLFVGAPFRIFVWDCWTVAGIVSLRVGPKGRVEDGGGGRK